MFEKIKAKAERIIVAATTKEELEQAKIDAGALYDNEIERLTSEAEAIGEMADFQDAVITGGKVYTLPGYVSVWLRKARGVNGIANDATSCVLVSEYEGRTWAVCADGHRLHAHAAEGVPVGVYRPLGARLTPATGIVKVDFLALAADLSLGKSEIVEPTPCKFTGYGSGVPLCGWKMDGDSLQAPAEKYDYFVNRYYWKDALSLSHEYGPPEWGIHPGMKPLRRMNLYWGQAFAVIMPMDLTGREEHIEVEAQ